MPGFQFSESMSGTWTRAGRTRPFAFAVTVRSDDVGSFLADRTASLEGFVDAEGLASHVPLEGTIVIKPLTARLIKYDFTFKADDGTPLRFTGQKDVSPLSPFTTMTTLPGQLFDGTGQSYASVALRFRPVDLLPMLGSMRLRGRR